ncbi:8941_t:CDS:2 [Funneliformis geosporum]|nr:8941_t:CDS:2 [Funneliformis geosporum]
MSKDNNPSDNIAAAIESFVISTNMKHVVTSHVDNSLILWDVDIDAKKFAIDKIDEIYKEGKTFEVDSRELRELSDDKLLIYSCDDNLYIRNLETYEYIQINSQQLYKDQYIRFLPNGDFLTLRDLQINVYSLKNSKKSRSSYNIHMIDADKPHSLEMITVSRIVHKNEQIFFAINDVIFQLDTENMKIENYYMIPNIHKTQQFNPKNCSWMGANKFDIKDYMGNYIIVETLTSSQCLLMFATGNQIKLIDLSIPVERLYDLMQHDHNLFIHSKFMDLKEIIRSFDQTNKSSRCKGKRLIWEYQSQSHKLAVHKIDQIQSKQTIRLDYKMQYEHHQILSNDDLVLLYGYGIYIFGFNETSNKIVPRYFYPNTDEFLTRKTLPNPILKPLKLSSQNIFDMINELLSSRKYFVEMSEEIIDNAIEREKSKWLDIYLNKLNNALIEDTTMNYRICGIFIKYLPILHLKFPNHYSRFIFIFSIIPNPRFNKPFFDFHANKKLVGYTEPVHAIQVYNSRESKFIRRIGQVSKFFQKGLYFIYSITGKYQRKRLISLVVPCLEFTKYNPDYNFWKELLLPPKDNPFVTFDDQTFYDSWNAEALINFKWNTFGRIYYNLLWGLFTMFLLTFGIGSTLSLYIMSDDTRNILLRISLILGSLLIFHEIRQFFWDPKRYILDSWNWVDLSAYIFPVFTACYWLYHDKPPLSLISISNLSLHFKFITFLRALNYFGNNFTIIFGVAQRILSFLLILLLFLIGFAHAFYIMLTPNEIYNLNEPVYNDDPNNPWNLVTKYQSISPNGDIKTELIQQPDSSSNQFSTYPSSLLAIYLFLTGDSSAFGSWTYQENPFMTILLIMFSFLIVVYLMNLFIGLLNLEIEKNKTHCLFMLRKAKVLAEIELFLLFPNQRRWRHWFPDVISYNMPIEDVRQKILDIDNDSSSYNSPYIFDNLRKLVGIKDKEGPMSKNDRKDLVNGFMKKSDYEDIVNMIKDEIRILLNPDIKDCEVTKSDDSKDDIVVAIDIDEK